ncbi:uncharacterized protein N7487_011471 [Penicillium crustosum]|uniref:uncharacterized protein n=1 Tax=Penicillium crustosum TaxID=36656 RepID=UPI0023853C80|nr:uncharacterized protein N7487_011471 [Penicillium crustosum]KAJ5393830.1 hypothetical protein N7487_011471 [Penicillium crustosum]
MTVPEFDEGPSKRICDDLGLANMIVKSSEDLTMPPGYPVKSAILDDEYVKVGVFTALPVCLN